LTATSEPILELRNVSKSFFVRQGIFRHGPAFQALHDVSFALRRGKFYGLVGESGSGKTTLARLLIGLLAPNKGQILFEGHPLGEILRIHKGRFRRQIQMVFQNPFLSLDPKWRIKRIVEEGIQGWGRMEKMARVEKALERVGLGEQYLERFPGELSGGERQRVAIARALVLNPEFLILDEPTSQLDVSVQAQVVALLKELHRSFQGGILLITHDLPLVNQLAEEILVLHQGRLVEQGEKSNLISSPKSDYTKRLLRAVPTWP